MSQGDKTIIVFFILWILVLFLHYQSVDGIPSVYQFGDGLISFLSTAGLVFFGFVGSIVIPFMIFIPLGNWIKKFKKPTEGDLLSLRLKTLSNGKKTVWYKSGLIYSEEIWKDGMQKYSYKNGRTESMENYKENKQDGKQTYWYKNGQKKSEKNYKDGKLDGKHTKWYENGKIKSEINYKDDEFDGKSTYWYENGRIELEVNYKDGECISGDC
jgi:antitoxin component YwqK of YwqJK toxin-antitoxin module